MSAVEIAVAASSIDECYRCGYALHGIANKQACPECGLLAERSRNVSEELHDSHPRWLNGLSRGIVYLLLAVLLAVSSPFIGSVIQQIADDARIQAWMTPRPRAAMPAIPAWVKYAESIQLISYDVAALLALLSLILLSRPEGEPIADARDKHRRRWLRIVGIIPLVSMAFLHINREHYRRASNRWMFGRAPTWDWTSWDSATIYIGIALLTLGCVPLPLLLFRHLRSLAKRAHSAHLAEHCTIVGTLVSCSLLYIALALLISENADAGDSARGRADRTCGWECCSSSAWRRRCRSRGASTC